MEAIEEILEILSKGNAYLSFFVILQWIPAILFERVLISVRRIILA